MKLVSADIKALEKFLVEEIALCDEYLKIITEEQAAVVKLDSATVTLLGEKRSAVVEKLTLLREERALLVERVTGDEFTRVSDMVAQGCGPADKKRLLALASKVKARLAIVDNKTREFGQIVNFSLGLVNGEISILWSATQPVSRTYNAHGGLVEGVQPGPTRTGTSLGKA
jgi:FlgN protein